jgi:predicted O-methyltransferase YrrM
MPKVFEVLDQIGQLPQQWHKAGSLSIKVLRAIARHGGAEPLAHTLETGSGKSTLLFSHLSRDHKVFAVGVYEKYDTLSIANVRTSPIFNAATVEFVEGPTQLTLPGYSFTDKLDVALIDGPHGYPFPDLEYYYIYQHLKAGALLIVDDIHIATVRHLFDFLSEDEMFELVEIVDTTAFFRRTAAPMFHPHRDGWWLQAYNKKRHPVTPPMSAAQRLRRVMRPLVPAALRVQLRKFL